MMSQSSFLATHTLTSSHPHREHKHGHRALMMAAQEGDEIIVDILVACVSCEGGRGGVEGGGREEVTIIL